MKTQLKELIAQGKTSSVISKLMKIKEQLDDDLANEIILQSARFEEFSRNKRIGKLGDEHQDVSIAKINESLLGVISKLPDEVSPEKKEATPESKPRYSKYWKWIVGLGVVMGIFSAMSSITGYSLKDFLDKESITTEKANTEKEEDLNEGDKGNVNHKENIEKENTTIVDKNTPKKQNVDKPDVVSKTEPEPEVLSHTYTIKGQIVDHDFSGIAAVEVWNDTERLGLTSTTGAFNFSVTTKEEIQIVGLHFKKTGYAEENKSIIVESGVADAKKVQLQKEE